jgi:hypothetical protein
MIVCCLGLRFPASSVIVCYWGRHTTCHTTRMTHAEPYVQSSNARGDDEDNVSMPVAGSGGRCHSGKRWCFRLESNQAPAFRRGGGMSLTGSRGKRARAQNRTGVAQGRPVYSRRGVHRPPLAWGDYPVSIRARGVHNPLCCLYTIITVLSEGVEPPFPDS